MSSDIILVIGIVLGALTIPAILSAAFDGNAPRVAAFVAVAAGGMMVYAITNKPGGYTINELPEVFARVVALAIR